MTSIVTALLMSWKQSGINKKATITAAKEGNKETMNLKLPENILEFWHFQKSILRKYRHYIKDKMHADYKRAAIFVYWLNDYIEYIRTESTFNPHKLINYKRGQIVFVNFGYRIGSELGGNHYAIVLDVKNSRYNNTLTVVPLKSFKNKETSYSKIYQVRLGETISQLLLSKADSIILETTQEILDNASVIKNMDSISSAELDALMSKMRLLKRKIRIARNIVEYTKKLKKESVADLGQITTISKQRINMPCKANDILTNIIVPNELMSEIDKKMNYLYCHLDETVQE